MTKLLALIHLIASSLLFEGCGQTNKITYTNEGDNEYHWCGFFPGASEQTIRNHLNKSIEDGKKIDIDRNTKVTTSDFIRTIIYKDKFLDGFPYCKGPKAEDVVISSIEEWTNFNGLEAIIKINHPSGCGLAFFPTDYSFNKKTYLKQKKVSVNLMGLIYSLKNFDVKEFNKVEEKQYSEDFCGYQPVSDKMWDTINFIGFIQSIKEQKFGEISGVALTIKITPDFSLAMFIAKDNIKIPLQLNQHVSGFAWVQGTLEK